MLEIFYVFGGKVSESPELWAYYRNRGEAKDFEKVYQIAYLGYVHMVPVEFLSRKLVRLCVPFMLTVRIFERLSIQKFER